MIDMAYSGLIIFWLLSGALSMYHLFTEGTRKIGSPCPLALAIPWAIVGVAGGCISLFATVIAVALTPESPVKR